jgi:hypothetical protein
VAVFDLSFELIKPRQIKYIFSLIKQILIEFLSNSRPCAVTTESSPYKTEQECHWQGGSGRREEKRERTSQAEKRAHWKVLR